mmetsp:Transcript_21564/g.33425  ORF Transcript_21564/g.33425 Transcript_21564/m.33425 type:complete len:259 (-) Transcript_21564:54-830(-)
MDVRLRWLVALAVLSVRTAGLGHGFVHNAEVRVSDASSLPVRPPPGARAAGLCLSQYMALPVEQYVLVPMPLNSTLTRGTCGYFELAVPTIRFMWLDVRPVVEASVRTERDRVIIQSNKCVLSSESNFIERVRLNERFDFSVEAVLTWEDGDGDGDVAEREVRDDGSMCTLSAETVLSVDVDVPAPFSAIPRRVIQKMGNVAMRASVRYIQKNFLEGLAGDYARWSTNLEYREFREGLSSNDSKVGDMGADRVDGTSS